MMEDSIAPTNTNYSPLSPPQYTPTPSTPPAMEQEEDVSPLQQDSLVSQQAAQQEVAVTIHIVPTATPPHPANVGQQASEVITPLIRS
jgi:hypothetical protein